MKTLILIILLFFGCYATGQNLKTRRTFGKDFAKKELLKLTGDSRQYNSGKKNLLLPDKKTTINFVDSILFKKYGKENILDQKPYEIYLIDNYWWVKGTIPKEAVGGSFKIIVNAVDKELIYLIHQK